MPRLNHTLAAALIATLLLAAAGSASVPALMSYQGKLADASGQPVADGSHTLIFGLYAAATGGTALWTETQTVQVAGGVFSVLLGSVNPLPDTAFQGTTWLETTVDGTVLSPRVQIVSSGYAIRAGTAETVPDGSITTPKLADLSVTASKIVAHSVTTTSIANGTITFTDMSPSAVSQIGASARTGMSVYSVKDYGAAGNGTTDDTTVFQSVLDTAAAAGGGIVWVPTGSYKIAGHLNIPANVSLEGIFRSPTARTQNYGSTLLAYEGKNAENGTPFIFMNANTVIKGITIFYPQQSNTVPVPYPWTIRGWGDNCTILDVLIVNPWQAVDFGTMACGRHLIRNLYSQPLKTGIFVDQCFDVGRIENVHLWPFWDTGQAVMDFQKANGTAFIFKKTDWEMVTGCFCITYKVGFQFSSGDYGPGNVLLTNSGADGCTTTVLVDDCQSHCGIVWTNGQFMGAADVKSTNTGPVKFNNCSFYGMGGVDSLLSNRGAGLVGFNGCQFQNWDRNSNDSPALYFNGTRATVTGCYFLSSGEKQITCDPGVYSAVITGNTMAGGKRITKNTTGQIIDSANTTQ